jgi:hypothetical protein
MELTITKGTDFDRIAICRADGTTAETRFPKKGPVPHDAVHYHVESVLALTAGFWGLVAAGHHPEDVQAMAKAGGHASARRATIPDVSIVELLQAERLVECFEATVWGGPAEPDIFRGVARAACAASHVPLPELDDQTISGIAKEIAALAADWIPAPVGHSITLHWPSHDT